MSVYTARIVERNGTVVRTLVNANITSVVDQLNEPGEIQFDYPKYDPPSAVGQAADVQVLKREVQVLRDGVVIAWGVPLRKSAASSRGEITVTAPGVAWFFGRRFIDTPVTEQLTNPGFESGLTGWTAVNCTATVISSPTRLGANAVRLTQAVTGADAYLQQILSVETAGPTPLGHTFAGHYYIESLNGPALDARGIYARGSTGGVLIDSNWQEIDEFSLRGEWQRVETTYDIGATQTQVVEARLYCPNGSIIWDALHLVHPEGFALTPAGGNAATIAGDLLDFVQNAPAKSTLNIGKSIPAPGPFVPFPKAWGYVDHTPLIQAINDELAPLGFDWSIQLAGPAKTFTTHVPRKGADRSATVTLQLGVNIASYDFDEDGTAVDTYVIMLGDGDGPDREESITIDTSQLSGLVLQGLHSAPPGTTVNLLDPLSADKLARKKRLVRLPSVTTYPGATDLVGLLATGDVVAVVINDGAVQVSSNYRIVRRELNPRTDTMKLTLNEDFGLRGGIQTPAVTGAVSGIGTRVQDIERATYALRRQVIEERPPFSLAGALTLATSPEYVVRTGGPLVLVEARLVTAGSTATTFKVLRNGVDLGVTVTIAASVTNVKAYLGGYIFASGDRLQVQTTGVGTGAKDLTVLPLMKSAA